MNSSGTGQLRVTPPGRDPSIRRERWGRGTGSRGSVPRRSPVRPLRHLIRPLVLVTPRGTQDPSPWSGQDHTVETTTTLKNTGGLYSVLLLPLGPPFRPPVSRNRGGQGPWSDDGPTLDHTSVVPGSGPDLTRIQGPSSLLDASPVAPSDRLLVSRLLQVLDLEPSTPVLSSTYPVRGRCTVPIGYPIGRVRR